MSRYLQRFILIILIIYSSSFSMTEVLNNEIVSLVDVMNFEKAHQLANNDKRTNPNNAWAWLVSGWVFFSEGKFQEALESINKSIQLAPNYIDAYRLRGKINYNLEEFQKCRADMDSCIKHGDQTAEPTFYRGVSFYSEGNYDATIRELSKIVSDDSFSARSYYFRGLARGKLQEDTAACQDFMYSIQCDSNYVWPYAELATYYNSWEYHSHAIELCTQAIAINSSFAEAYCQRGYAYYNLEEYQKAKNDFQNAVKCDPSYEYAQSLFKLCEEIDLASQEIDTSNLDSTLMKTEGLSLYKEQQYLNAIEKFTTYLSVQPASSEIRYKRGVSYYKLEMMAEAKQDFQKALASDIHNALSYYYLGLLYKKEKNYTLAVKNFNLYLAEEKSQQNIEWVNKARSYVSALGGKTAYSPALKK